MPWFAYYDSVAGSWVEGYYDDVQSLAVKWDMVNQRGLAGTGIWALLMDEGSSDLWNLLATKFVSDVAPPTGGIVPLPAGTDASGVGVSWRHLDIGSGVGSYTVQVRDRAGGEWTSWQTDVSWTSAHFVGTEGHSYEFRVSAVDMVGNRQPWTPAALDVSSSLQVGGFAGVNVGVLNVRSGTGTGFAVLDQLAAGDRLAILGGPVLAGGLQWYWVQFDWTEWPSSSFPRYGWAAAGDASGPFLVPAPAPTVTTISPAISGYAVSPRRISPNGDGTAESTAVTFSLAAAASDARLDVINGGGTVVASQALGPLAPGTQAVSWDGRAAGAPVADGVYLLRLTVVDGAGSHVAPVAGVDWSALSTWGVVASVTPPGATYIPLAPSRLLDTRVGNGLAGTFAAGTPRTFQVAGRGGVPANAVGVTGTLTATGSSGPGFVFLGPDPTATPTSSTLNVPAGDTRAGGVTVALGPGGTLSATFGYTGTTHLLFDVTGYFVPDASGATYIPLAPSRLLDTRVGNGLSGTFAAGTPRTFQVAGRGGVPANAVGVTGTLTATGSSGPGFVFLGPDPTATPTSSTLNVPAGDTRAGGVTVALGPGGTLSATFGYTGTTHLLFDVTGYFVPDASGATYIPLAPSRLLDTRVGNGLSGTFAAGTPRTFQVAGRGGVPANAVGVTGTLTATGSSGPGFVFLGPDPTATPTSSTLNVPAGDTRAGGVTVALGPGGTLSATFGYTGTTHLLFDVTGYFVP